MTKAERGMKRVCSGCGAKFYDLNKDPIVCPVCETVFTAKETTRAKPVAAAEKPSKEVDTDQVEEVEDSAGPEIVSLSDVADEEDTDDDVDLDDADIDLGDDDAEIPDDDDGDAFLEDDEEEGSDVTSIIPGSVKSEGEEP